MGKKVILITGASRGLGQFLSQELCSEYMVYAAVRNPNESSPNENIFFLELDLTNEDSISSCVKEVITREGKIDFLIQNAGIAISGCADVLLPQEARRVFDVNFFGPIRLVQLLLHHMRTQNHGTIIFISSIRGVESHPYFGIYSASKAALESVALDWAITLRQWNIKVSVIQPGPIKTGMKITHGNYFKTSTNPYSKKPDDDLKWESPQQTLNIIKDILSADIPNFAYQTSPEAHTVIAKHLIDPSRQNIIQELSKKWYTQLIDNQDFVQENSFKN